jgi:RHS repeat-associated protein
MNQPKAGEQKKPKWSRTVLLATNGSHSIIGEVAEGQAKAIAYSTYGYQSGQQKVTTRQGFNGQLREAHIGWYLLGNGYRAYNPRLMRFHSPDSWSPFWRGGLNAYMYCVGDPVNHSDPTGHFFEAVKLWAQENLSFGGSGAALAARNLSRRASGIQRQEAVYGLKAAGGVPTANSGSSNNSGLGEIVMSVLGAPAPRGNNSPAIHNIETRPKSQPSYAASGAMVATASRSPSPVATRRFSADANISRPRSNTSDSFNAPRTLWEGEAPKSPKRERMILLGGSSGTEKSHPRDRASTPLSNPTLSLYRNAGGRTPGNGWATDTSSNGYQNTHVFVQRQQYPVMNNPSDPGPSSNAIRKK